MQYNTDKENLKLREYGRNVQKLVDYIQTVEDKEKRNSYAETLVELMRQINPNVKEGKEYEQKVWDDLHIISEFQLEVESPYPTPDKTILGRKPDRVKYNFNQIKYKHYGKNMELLIEKAVATEDPDIREAAIVHIGKLMRTFYNVWNNDTLEDVTIIKNIQQLSDGKLTIDLEKVKEYNLFEVQQQQQHRPKNQDQKSRQRKGGGGGRRNQKRRRN